MPNEKRESGRGGSSRLALAGLVGLAIAVGSTVMGVGAAPVAVDVMTFNIRNSNGGDGQNAWPNRKRLVVDTIAAVSPDVIGLQEVLHEQIEYLETELADYRWLGIDRGLNGGVGLSEYTPIFYRRTELTPIESGNFWLTGTPDAPPEPREWRGRRRRLGRIATWARFHHLASGRELFVYNTHLTLRQGPQQVESAALLASRVARRAAGAPVVVLGDFNAPAEHSETWDVLTGEPLEPLRDAWTEARQRIGPAFTLSEFGPPTDWGVGRIDWILVGGAVHVGSVETVLHHAAGRYPSDHYPVAARLMFE